MSLLTNATPVALWHDIVHTAETKCAIQLREELEAYLVFLLIRYTSKPEVVKQILANEFLMGLHSTSRKREVVLQEVGDKCLLFTGLFPHIAEKRLVKIGYFVDMGRTAYDTISKKRHDLYHSLAHQFIGLMDILQSIRLYSSNIPDLLPFQAYDLWNETGSQRAFSVLKQYTSSIPLKVKD